ncbi:MAG: alpha/beta hydrolase, partial [Pseudomonadota bacterium]
MLATLVVLLGCSPFSDSALYDVEPRYDGSRLSFESFVETHDKAWPVPAKLETFIVPDGATLRYAFWPAPNPKRRAGVVVFFQGRTEFIEKNVYAYQALLDRNFEVWTLDWRGQGLSERLLPDEPEKGHIDSYATYLSDAEFFLRKIVKLDEVRGVPRILLAHSMGGAIGTTYLLRNPGEFDKAVFSAPLIKLPASVDNTLIRTGNRAKVAIRPSICTGLNPLSACLWQSEFEDDVDVCSIAGNAAADALIDRDTTEHFSHDATKVAEIECWIVNSRPAEPSLGLGGPTSGWLRETYEATDWIDANRSKLETPLLIVGGSEDRTVSNVGQAAFCDRDNSECCRLELEGAGHELLIETP